MREFNRVLAGEIDGYSIDGTTLGLTDLVMKETAPASGTFYTPFEFEFSDETGLATSEYVQNLWYLVPMCLGAWIGSFVSVERERKKRNLRAKIRRQKKELLKMKNTL